MDSFLFLEYVSQFFHWNHIDLRGDPVQREVLLNIAIFRACPVRLRLF